MSPLEKLRSDRQKLAIVRIEARAEVARSAVLLALLKNEFTEREVQRQERISRKPPP